MNGIYAHHNVVLITNEGTQEALKAQKDIDMLSKYNVMEKWSQYQSWWGLMEEKMITPLMVKDEPNGPRVDIIDNWNKGECKIE